VALFRGYRLPARILNALRGLLAGMLIILTVYGLLPADLRFSRAVILIGSIAIFVLLPFYRYLVSLIIPALSSNPFSVKGNSVIVADYEGFINISKLLKTSEKDQTTLHRVSITNDDISEDVLGNINQLVEIVRVNDIRQIVFSSHGINTSQIIDAMHSLSEFDLNIRIASADYQNLVGSRQLKY
jgi:hypothetical protein